MKKWIISCFALLGILSLVSCNKDEESQIDKETKAIDAYLKATNHKYLVFDGYGDRVVISKIGDGAPVHVGQTVKVTYTGRLFNDSSVVFASGIINDKIENVTVNGLKVGIASLLKGSVATLYIPSENAFGAAGKGLVPPNTTVRYDISVDTVLRTSTELSRFKTDSLIVKKYIDSVHVSNTIYNPAGFWYTIDASGTGDHPRPYDVVNFHYTLKLLSNGSTLSDSDGTSGIFGLIDGLKLGFLPMKEGGKATFYFTSGLGYGKDGKGDVPANANLVFVISLNSISN